MGMDTKKKSGGTCFLSRVLLLKFFFAKLTINEPRFVLCVTEVIG